MKDSVIEISYFDAMHCYNALLTQIKCDMDRIEKEPNVNLREFYKRKLVETTEVWNRVKAVLESTTITDSNSTCTVKYKDAEWYGKI